MFISTKSDGQIFINLKKKRIKKKKIKNSLSPHALYIIPSASFCFRFCLLFFSFSLSGTHISLFLPFSIRFSPETIYFVRVSISFILIEFSLNICHFSEFFKNPVFRFHSTLVAQKFVKYSDCLGIKRNFSRSLDFVRRT